LLNISIDKLLDYTPRELYYLYQSTKKRYLEKLKFERRMFAYLINANYKETIKEERLYYLEGDNEIVNNVEQISEEEFKEFDEKRKKFKPFKISKEELLKKIKEGK